MSREPEPSPTLTHIRQWVYQATVKRLDLHLRATEPSYNERQQAFLEMAELCKEAIEEIRVMTEQLWETNQDVREQSAELVTEAARHRAESAAVRESRLLNIFKGDGSQRDKPE